MALKFVELMNIYQRLTLGFNGTERMLSIEEEIDWPLDQGVDYRLIYNKQSFSSFVCKFRNAKQLCFDVLAKLDHNSNYKLEE